MKKYLNRFVIYLYVKLNPELTWEQAVAKTKSGESHQERLERYRINQQLGRTNQPGSASVRHGNLDPVRNLEEQRTLDTQAKG